MKRLACERRSAQARYEGKTLLEKPRKVSLRAGGAHPLQCHGQYHLADRRPILGAVVAASTIDMPDEIELLGDPQQRADVAHRTRTDRPRVSQVRLVRWVHGAKNDLSRYRASLRRIPDRLGGHAVLVAAHLALEEVHLSHVAERS